jgi:dihydroxyacetone kinase-like predicted kinase
MQKYRLEFILSTKDSPREEIRRSLAGLGENLIIAAAGEGVSTSGDLKICIHTDDPTLIFDASSQFGKLKSVKID